MAKATSTGIGQVDPNNNSRLLTPVDSCMLQLPEVSSTSLISPVHTFTTVDSPSEVNSTPLPGSSINLLGSRQSKGRDKSISTNVASSKKKMPYKFVLIWKLLGLVAVIINLLSLVCVVLAYSHEQWEIISYGKEIVTDFADQIYSAAHTEVYPDYYLISFNQSAISNSSEGAAKVSVAVSKTINNGMFKQCDTLTEESRQQLKMEEVVWLTNSCFTYTVSGPSNYAKTSPEYTRHLMTRMSQACMIVSTICLILTLIIGTLTFLFGQILLCIVTATLCLAAGLYQMFTGVTLTKRMNQNISPLTYTPLSVTLLPAESSPGVSLDYTWAAMVLATIAGVLWFVIYRLINKDIKILETESNGTYDHNFCCRT